MPIIHQWVLDAQHAREADLKDDLKWHRSEIARLTDLLVGMQRQGFASPPPVRQEPEEDLPTVVMEAIVGRAGTLGNSIGTQLLSEARRMLDKKMDPEVVASDIWTGDAGEDGV